MSWDEFSGGVMSACGDIPGVVPVNNVSTLVYPPSRLRSAYSGAGAWSLGGYESLGVQYVPTTGTLIVLNFAEVIQLTEEYYAPGSLGNFNLQLSVQAVNNQGTEWPANSYELVVIPMMTGVFVNERGTSSTFLSLLTKQDVLDSLQQQPYANYEIRRMVGGGFLDTMRSALGWVKGKLPAVRGVLEQVQNPYAQAGATVLKTMGYGKGDKNLDSRLM